MLLTIGILLLVTTVFSSLLSGTAIASLPIIGEFIKWVVGSKLVLYGLSGFIIGYETIRNIVITLIAVVIFVALIYMGYLPI